MSPFTRIYRLHVRCGLAVIFVTLVPMGFVDADDQTVERSRRAAAAKPPAAASASKGVAVYIPPSRGRAHTRSGGGTRGLGDLPGLSVLAPEHEGLTTLSQPTLYWYVSEPTEARIDFTLLDEEGIEPLLEASLHGPVGAGFHAVRLADFGLQLDLNVTYAWYVSLIPDSNKRSTDVVSGGAIRRVDVSPQLATQLEQGALPTYAVYAANGIWYDSLSSLGQAMESSPADASLRDQQAAFLDQADLANAAEFARRE